MIYAYSEATVPKVAIILRKAYGGAYIVMSSKHLKCDYNLAWPQAEIAVMGPEGAVKIVFRKEINAAEDPAAAALERTSPISGRNLPIPIWLHLAGYLDDVILPGESRMRLIAALESLREKRQPTPPRKHGNIPL